MRIFLLVILIVVIWKVFSSNDNYYPDKPGEHNDTFVETQRGGEPFDFRGYTITPLENFSIKARVLSLKSYNRGREAELSHLDLALGWGPMSDRNNLDYFKIWQNNRWYFWKAEELPISRSDVISHSANMHMIPGNKTAFEALNTARKGDIIELQGYLVKAEAPDGWHWTSSLSRHDTGDGSCEVVWVDSFKVLTQ